MTDNKSESKGEKKDENKAAILPLDRTIALNFTVGPADKDDKTLVEVLTIDSKTNQGVFKHVANSQILPGNVVLVRGRAIFPADSVVVLTASAENTCYTNNACFEGDATMQFKSQFKLPAQVLDGLNKTKDIVELLAVSLAERFSAGSFGFKSSAPTKKYDEWNVALIQKDGSQVRLVENKEMAPHQGIMLLADWAVGIAIYTGKDTKFMVNDGAEGRTKREAEKKAEAEKKKQQKEKERLEKEAKKPSPAQRAVMFEEKTGVKWMKSWTDVPDDGNCLIHAFWLGLTKLIENYPETRLAEDKKLPKDPEDLRQDFFKRLADDKSYKASMKSLFELYITGVDEGFLLGNEDFFTLPEHIRTRILRVKQDSNVFGEVSLRSDKPDGKGGGGSGGPSAADLADWACEACTSPNSGLARSCEVCGTPRVKPQAVDFDSFVTDYVAAVTTHTMVGGRKIYIQLGANELNALSRIYNVKLQTMTSDGLLQSLGAVTLDEIDPRIIEERDVHTFLPSSQREAKVQRLVRLLNVKRTHYYVHLPAPAAEAVLSDTEKREFSSTRYWSSPTKMRATDPSALPPLD